MLFRSGYGGIDSSQKNKIIRVPGLESVDVNGDTVFMTNEGISAINTCSDNGYWIVVNGRTSGKADHHICVFKFDSSGIHFKDTFSMGVSGSGSFRFSPDGNYLAFSHNDGATCDIFPFDRSQGIINTGSSNVIHVKGINGLAFSANSKVLYVLGLDSTAINYVLLQYDLTASNVLATEKLVTEPGFFTSVDELALAHLILGLDNKIYLARNNSDFIGVINNPEYLNSASSPNACNFLFYGFRLEYDADCDGSKSLMGFPNFPTRVADANNKSMGYRALNCNKYIFTNSNCRYKKWLIRNSNNTTLLSINNTDTLNYTFNSTGTYYVLLVIDQDTTVQIISVTLPNAPIYGQNQIHSTSNLAAGVYFVKLTVNGKDYLNKLIRY